MANPRSTASIAGHPIHPMLVPFPIAFFVSAFVADLIVWQTGSQAWATASVWLLGAGLVMAALAATMGLIDVLGGLSTFSATFRFAICPMRGSTRAAMSSSC